MHEKLGEALRSATRRTLEVWNEYLYPALSWTFFIRPLHFAVTRFIADIQKGDRVLELGSGYPWYELYAGKVGENGTFIALDINPAIQRRSRLISRTASQIVGTAEKLPFGDNTFDKVLVHEGPHLSEEVYRALKPGGKALISYVQIASLPYNAIPNFLIYRGSGFENVKIFPGTPAFIDPSRFYYAWNWYVSARKPEKM